MAEEGRMRVSTAQLMQAYQVERMKMGQLKRQERGIAMQLAEIDNAMLALGAISEGKDSGDVIVPLGAGVLVEAKLSGGKKVKLSMPAGVVVDLTVVETKKRLESLRKDLERGFTELRGERQKVRQNLKGLETAVLMAQQHARQHQQQKQ